MWQVEYLLRANGCDIDRIRQNIILRYPEDCLLYTSFTLLGSDICSEEEAGKDVIFRDFGWIGTPLDR